MTPNKTRSGLFETPRIKNVALKSEGTVLTRSSLSDAPRAKITPTTPRAAKISKGTTPKADPSPHLPLQSARYSVDQCSRSSVSVDQPHRVSLSVDQSPRSAESKPLSQPRTPKIGILPDKRPRVAKGPELQSELSVLQEELKNAKDRLNSLENEKAHALDELEEARRRADEANQKLTAALAAQRQAEEDSEIEKFRVIEIEYAGIEASKQHDESWKQELEHARSQHAIDLSALHSTMQELQQVKRELAMTTDMKNAATSHADSALKIAEVNVEKVGKLSAEIVRLKALLDVKTESKANETTEHVQKLTLEVESLLNELEGAKESEKKLMEMEAVVEGLRIEVADAKRTETDAQALVDEWKKKAELLEVKVEEAIRSEELASEALASVVKKLEECNASLCNAESNISCLKRRVEQLEMEAARYRQATVESDMHLASVKRKITEYEKTIEELKSEIQRMEDDRISALNDENRAASNLPVLLEEKKKLLFELEASRDDIEKTKKAMEVLSSALHELSSEARYSHEQLQIEHSSYADAQIQMEQSKLALASMEERCEMMLVEAKGEVDRLMTLVGGVQKEAEKSKLERMSKEHNYMSLIRKSEEEVAGIKEKMSKLASKLVETEAEGAIAKEEGAQLLSRLMQAKFEAAKANEATEEAKADILELKDRLLDKENELQSISQENEELRVRDEAATRKIKELSVLLEEFKSQNGNNVSINSKKEYNVAPKMLGTPDFDVPLAEECIDKTEVQHELLEDHGFAKAEAKKFESRSQRKQFNMEDEKKWESCKIVSDGLALEAKTETESLASSFRSKIGNDSFDLRTGGDSLSSKFPEKKKKSFMHKFKGLLKKNSSSR